MRFITNSVALLENGIHYLLLWSTSYFIPAFKNLLYRKTRLQVTYATEIKVAWTPCQPSTQTLA